MTVQAEGAPAAGRAGSEAEEWLDPRRIFRNLPGATRDEVLAELSERLAREGLVAEPGELAARLIERERLGCTGVGGGVAIPHCTLPGLTDVVVAVAATGRPIDFGAADGIPVDLVFLVASPPQAPSAHLQALARISRLLRAPGVAEGLRRANSAEALRDVLRDAQAWLPVAR